MNPWSIQSRLWWAEQSTSLPHKRNRALILWSFATFFLVRERTLRLGNWTQAWLLSFLFLVFGCAPPVSACFDFSLPPRCHLFGNLWRMSLGTVTLDPGCQDQYHQSFPLAPKPAHLQLSHSEQNPPNNKSDTAGTGDTKSGSVLHLKPNGQLCLAVHTCCFLTSYKLLESVRSKFLLSPRVWISATRLPHLSS